jgi:hypothetical protein
MATKREGRTGFAGAPFFVSVTSVRPARAELVACELLCGGLVQAIHSDLRSLHMPVETLAGTLP